MVILMIGPSGSGKSTYSSKLSSHYWDEPFYISSDLARSVIGGGEEDQSVNKQVFEWVYHTAKYILSGFSKNSFSGRNIIIDSTALTIQHRKGYIDIARKYNSRIVAIFIDTPIDQCKINNQNRKRKVPDYVIDRQFKMLQTPTVAEGFDDVIVVDWKKINENFNYTRYSQ